ncbi:prolipoprotein diacylglyceryl transferase family protein [Halomonas sp. 1390]|uniref:prolipoprotein diacylglyceryl transferase family protein n=1 Tax=Halomonas sp. B23F22_3 TaxID=3459516 RepID=UPI00373E86DF
MNLLDQSVALGPLGLSLGQLLIAFSLVVALVTGQLLGRRQRLRIGDSLSTLALVMLTGARLVFVARYLEDYAGPLQMLDIRDGGFDAIGALVAGGAYAGWRLWRHPEQRKALGGALAAGLLTWGVSAGSLGLMAAQSRPMPDTELITLSGESLVLPTLQAAEERPMVVNLWATWCPPCRREMPVLADAQEATPEITFVFLDQGEDPAQVQRFLEHQSLDLDHLLIDPELAFGERVGARVMPTTLFYDADGQLLDTHFGELSRATLNRALDELY